MSEPGADDPLVEQAKLRGERHQRWLRDGDLSVAHRLAQIGVLGWIIVIPMVGGAFLGRWLDGQMGTAVFWTAPLIMLGVVLGGWFAWRWMNAA